MQTENKKAETGWQGKIVKNVTLVVVAAALATRGLSGGIFLDNSRI